MMRTSDTWSKRRAPHRAEATRYVLALDRPSELYEALLELKRARLLRKTARVFSLAIATGLDVLDADGLDADAFERAYREGLRQARGGALEALRVVRTESPKGGNRG